jgi:hypothetical protein
MWGNWGNCFWMEGGHWRSEGVARARPGEGRVNEGLDRAC